MADVFIDLGGQKWPVNYSYQDVKSICRQAGRITLFDLLGRLAGQDLDVLSVALLVAFESKNPRITVEKIDVMVAEFLKGDGRIVDITNPITEAIEATGAVKRTKKEAPDPLV